MILSNTRDDYKPILRATHSIIFLGTPHHGSALADSGWLNIAQHMVSWARMKHSSTALATELKPFSDTLHDISHDFADIALKFEMVSFQEQKTTRLLPPLKGDQLVSRR